MKDLHRLPTHHDDNLGALEAFQGGGEAKKCFSSFNFLPRIESFLKIVGFGGSLTSGSSGSTC